MSLASMTKNPPSCSLVSTKGPTVVEISPARTRTVRAAGARCGLALLDSGDAADLEERDARGELEDQRLAGLRASGQERGDPTAVSDPIRRVTASDASARLLVPAGRFEALAGLIEVIGEQPGMHGGRGSVHAEQLGVRKAWSTSLSRPASRSMRDARTA